MAHFAKIENGIVTDIIVVDDKDCDGGKYPTSNPIGQNFIKSHGLEGHYEQTSYNNNFRGVYAQKGFLFDAEKDIFIENFSE